MNFVALDVETANFFMHSICQIGIAEYSAGELISEWETLVNPEDDFSPVNIEIHGITEEMVADAPTFTDIYEQLSIRLRDKVVVCHTHFDRVSLAQAFDFYGLQPIDCTWLDSAKVTRRTWEQFAKTGYGLKNVCGFLGYEFGHHDALADAKAAGFIILEAYRKTGLDIDGWLERVKRGISDTKYTVKQEGDEDGPLFGEVVVFTGELSCERKEAAKMAAQAGCGVADGVNKRTTLLVVGTQDRDKLAGYEKSSKHRKAEEFLSKGQSIKIIDEASFFNLLSSTGIDANAPIKKSKKISGNNFQEESVPSNYFEGSRIFSFIIETFNRQDIKENIDKLRERPGALSFNLYNDEDGLYRIIHNSGLHIGYIPVELQNSIIDILKNPCDGFLFKIDLYERIDFGKIINNALLGIKQEKNYFIPTKMCIHPSPCRFINRMVKEKVISKNTGNSLISSGYINEERIRTTPDKDLLALKGVNKTILARIRNFRFAEKFVFLNPHIWEMVYI